MAARAGLFEGWRHEMKGRTKLRGRRPACSAMEAILSSRASRVTPQEKAMDESRRRKTQIERLLKKGVPRTVEEWKALYGEPRMDLENQYAREYGLWTAGSGTRATCPSGSRRDGAHDEPLDSLPPVPASRDSRSRVRTFGPAILIPTRINHRLRGI